MLEFFIVMAHACNRCFNFPADMFRTFWTCPEIAFASRPTYVILWLLVLDIWGYLMLLYLSVPKKQCFACCSYSLGRFSFCIGKNLPLPTLLKLLISSMAKTPKLRIIHNSRACPQKFPKLWQIWLTNIKGHQIMDPL